MYTKVNHSAAVQIFNAIRAGKSSLWMEGWVYLHASPARVNRGRVEPAWVSISMGYSAPRIRLIRIGGVWRREYASVPKRVVGSFDCGPGPIGDDTLEDILLDIVKGLKDKD